MKKKIIALVMIIPVVFLIALFSVGKVAGVYADIPVTGIRITTQNDGGFIDVDVASYDPIEFFAQVEPVNARNGNYEFEISGVGGDDAPNGFYFENGKLMITDVGKAKITAISAEKGFKDSVVVTAYSTKVLKISPLVNGEEVVGDTVEIRGGDNVFSAKLYPENLSGESRIFKEVGDERLLMLNSVTGVAQAVFSGETFVRITCPDGIDGLESLIKVKVDVDTSKGFAVNGKSDGAEAFLKNGAKSARLFVEGASDSLSESDVVLPDGFRVSNIERLSENRFVLTLAVDEEFGDETINVKIGETDVSLSFSEYNVDLLTSYYGGGEDEIKQKNKTKVTYVAYSVNGDDAQISFDVIEGHDVIDLKSFKNTAEITAKERGYAKIKVTATLDGEVVKEIIKTICVVPNVYSVEFVEGAKTYGIENILTVGGKKVGGQFDETRLTLRVRTENTGDSILSEGLTRVDFSDDKGYFNCKTDDSVANASGVVAKLRVKGTGLTDLFADMTEYNEYFGTSINAKIRLRAVRDGVNVGDYETLRTATANEKIVVLTQNVMLGVKNGVTMSLDDLKKDVGEFETTYDKTFLKAAGESTKIKYLIEFKNNVYGNGYEINADKFTRCVDATGNPLIFRGPLNFVAISNASVKGQDNVSFLVRTDGVLIDNVTLKGCSDESLFDDGKFNLSNLNNVGTTLEIAASARIVNSRVSNGRTVMRIFAGKSTAGSPVVENKNDFNIENERINVRIESCVLANAREFIVKIGSNRALKQIDGAQRRLLDAAGNAYLPYAEKNKTDEYFNDNYLICDVTLKDSVLETSGLFSVGMETHFSGAMLYDGSLIKTWKDCAATSFASALRIVGDVKMLDWKNLSNVDSSTLIEVTGDANPWLTLNVSEMLKEVARQKRECADIIVDNGGTKYVHGGIAFYGGGYNYSYVDFSNALDDAKEYGVYDVNISVLEHSADENIRNQGKMLPTAAGSGDFRFYLHNNVSKRNLLWQEQIKKQGLKISPTIAEETK